jgi:hypothetical protein
MISTPSSPRRLVSPRWLGLGAILLALPAGLAANDWQSLLNNTPFGQPPANAAAPTGELEFRGVVQEEGVYLINLYNPATKTAQWIPVNGKVAGLEVRSYDAGSDKVQITSAGRPLTLPLKQAHVSLLAAPAAPPKGALAENADNADNPDNPDRAARRAQVRDMIRARMEGGGPGGANGPFMRNIPPEAQAMIEEFRRRRAEAAASQPAVPPGQQPQNRRPQPSP